MTMIISAILEFFKIWQMFRTFAECWSMLNVPDFHNFATCHKMSIVIRQNCSEESDYSFWTGAKVAIQRGKSGAVEFADLRVRGMQGIKESWVIVIREGARASGGIRRRSQGATVKHRDELGLRGLGGLDRFKIRSWQVKDPQALRGSFSSVSMPNFATKYSKMLQHFPISFFFDIYSNVELKISKCIKMYQNVKNTCSFVLQQNRNARTFRRK